MQTLNNLSLRSKFLAAPIIGLLMMLFVGILLVTVYIKEQHIFSHIDRQEMKAVEQLTSLFTDLSIYHEEIHDLLVNRSRELGIDKLYQHARNNAAKIAIIRAKLTSEQFLTKTMDVDGSQLLSKIRDGFNSYYDHHSSTVNLIQSDLPKAQHHLHKATDLYNQLQIDLFQLLGAIRAHITGEFTELRTFNKNAFIGLVILALASIVAMLTTASFFSRTMVADFRMMITALSDLAMGNSSTPIPENKHNYAEMANVVNALAVFKQSLRKNEEHTDTIMQINQALEAEVQQRRKNEDKLALAASVFENSLEGIVITDTKARILDVNSAFENITGYSREEAIGQTPRLLKSNRHDESFYQNMWARITQKGMWQGEIWNRRKNGEVYPEWRNITMVKDKHGKPAQYISIFTDITEKKLSEEKIYHLAHYDVLTGLPNRMMFKERLNHSLASAQRNNSLLAVLFLDLDRFKLINDTFGHPTGDLLLKSVSERIHSCLREEDTVGRQSGDEFILILENLKSNNNAAQVAEKILAAINQQLFLDGNEIYPNASIGISLFPNDGTDAATLIKNADSAMYKSKQSGRNTYSFYTEAMQESARERLDLENKLRHGLELDEFILYYQPRIDSRINMILGAEALIRWQQPELGLVPPDKFIPIAEETGLILPIGEWVLDAACRQYKEWQENGIAPQSISVNLSGRQFHDPALVDTIYTIVTDSGVDPKNVELEITESFLMQDPELSRKAVTSLRELGFHISIDDFGTAYSSLSQLKQFPVDHLKIDRSFIRDIPTDADDMAITCAIISMGQNLNMDIIAEGVETREQLEFLKASGCFEVQGYYYSPPKPAPVFSQLLEDGIITPEDQSGGQTDIIQISQATDSA